MDKRIKLNDLQHAIIARLFDKKQLVEQQLSSTNAHIEDVVRLLGEVNGIVDFKNVKFENGELIFE